MLSRSSSPTAALMLVLVACMLASANGQLSDVLKAVEKIDPHTPEELRFDLGDGLPEGGHLQGVQAFQRDGRDLLLLSGSADSFSYLITVDLSVTNRTAVLTKLLDAPYRHAGGFQMVDGRFVAIGLEDNHARDKSKIWVLDMAADHSRQRRIPLIEIERAGEIKRSTAGAVAMARFGERHLLIVGGWDSATLDFYESNGSPLDDERCRFQMRETWSAALADRSDWSDTRFGSYQNINLITDKDGRCFLAAFCREGDADRLDVHELRMGKDTPTSHRLRKRASRQFHCAKTNFKAGAGL
jgi:hypothetical protein